LVGVICIYEQDAVILFQDDKDRIEVTEITRNMKNKYFNDNIIDMINKQTIMWLGADKGKELYCFPASFFVKLTEKKKRKGKPVTRTAREAHKMVAKWTKNVDIFQKTLLFFPIVLREHWRLVVVIRPGVVDDNENRPCVLYLDSLPEDVEDVSYIYRTIISYLAEEWETKGKGVSPWDVGIKRTSYPDIPKQVNTYDCGVYLVKYLQLVCKMFCKMSSSSTATDIENNVKHLWQVGLKPEDWQVGLKPEDITAERLRILALFVEMEANQLKKRNLNLLVKALQTEVVHILASSRKSTMEKPQNGNRATRSTTRSTAQRANSELPYLLPHFYNSCYFSSMMLCLALCARIFSKNSDVTISLGAGLGPDFLQLMLEPTEMGLKQNGVIKKMFDFVVERLSLTKSAQEDAAHLLELIDFFFPKHTNSFNTTYSQTCSRSCGHDSTKTLIENFIILPLFGDSTVQVLMDAFLAGESIVSPCTYEGCSSSSSSSSCSKKYTVVDGPQILILQLKRVDDDGNKNCKHYAFEATIEFNDCTYELFAVIMHAGVMNSGHYTTIANASNKWWDCDDMSAKITESKFPGELTSSLKNASILFYSRKEKESLIS
jgi:ubiquitin C-terminal hydrolase